MSKSTPTDNVIDLAALIGPFDDIKRTTKLPSGQNESDSHHSFSLALIAYSVAVRYCPELDTEKVMKFALTHDLLELITGDEPTIHHNHEAHLAKKVKETEALPVFKKRFKAFPEIIEAMEVYERLDCPESAFVYVLDKACTTWTHFFDDGDNLRSLGIVSHSDVDRIYDGQQAKIARNLHCDPPQIALDIFEQSFKRMSAELLSD